MHHSTLGLRVIEEYEQAEQDKDKALDDARLAGRLDDKVPFSSYTSILGDIRLWVGDPSTSSSLVSLPRFSQPTNPESITASISRCSFRARQWTMTSAASHG